MKLRIIIYLICINLFGTSLLFGMDQKRNIMSLKAQCLKKMAQHNDQNSLNELPVWLKKKLNNSLDEGFIGFAGHKSWIRALATSSNSEIIVSGLACGEVVVWKRQSNNEYKHIQVLNSHEAPVYSLSMSEDCKTIASGLGDGTIAVYKLQDSGEYQLEQILNGLKGFIESAAISKDAKTIIGGSYSTLMIWILQDNGRYKCISNPDQFNSYINTLAISENSDTRAYGFGDGTILVYNKYGKQILHDAGGTVARIAISKDCKSIISSGYDKKIRVWKMKDSGQFECVQTLSGHEGSISALAISKDRKIIASGSWDGTIRIWELQDNGDYECTKILNCHEGVISKLDISEDNEFIVSSSWDKTLRLWDLWYFSTI